jgi:hypothetical protein
MFASTIFYKVEHADENYLFQLINIVSLLPRHQQSPCCLAERGIQQRGYWFLARR